MADRWPVSGWRIFSSPPCLSILKIQVLRISAQSCFAYLYFLPGTGTITCTELGPWWGRDRGASADCFSQQQIIASVPGATSQDLNTFVYQSILDCRLQDVLEIGGESSSGNASFVAGAASGVGPQSTASQLPAHLQAEIRTWASGWSCSCRCSSGHAQDILLSSQGTSPDLRPVYDGHRQVHPPC